MRSVNEVEIYDKFLSVCDDMNPKLANDIKDIIDGDKRKVGLLSDCHPLPRNKNAEACNGHN